MDQVKTAGYRIQNIILIESSFKRMVTIPFEHSDNFIPQLNIETIIPEPTTEQEHLFVVTTETLFKWIYLEDTLFEIKVVMSGIFEKHGETTLSEETFKSVNAPAIIYPFTREHVCSLCAKGAIGNILLPAINFKP